MDGLGLAIHDYASPSTASRGWAACAGHDTVETPALQSDAHWTHSSRLAFEGHWSVLLKFTAP
jgi:hypothetical protein